VTSFRDLHLSIREMSASSRLREETRDEHRAIEAVVPLMREAIDRDGYFRYLAAVLGFVEPLERELALHLDARPKRHLLVADLSSLGATDVEISALPRAMPLRIDDRAEAYGALYVMEGSTLGGALIAKHLRARIDDCPLRYLAPYGESAGASWKRFRAELDAELRDEQADQAVESARRTFRAFAGWLASRA
jgi:heme oxygenase